MKKKLALLSAFVMICTSSIGIRADIIQDNPDIVIDNPAISSTDILSPELVPTITPDSLSEPSVTATPAPASAPMPDSANISTPIPIVPTPTDIPEFITPPEPNDVSETSTATATPEPTAAPTSTVVPGPTDTPTPTVAPQPTNTPTPTATPKPVHKHTYQKVVVKATTSKNGSITTKCSGCGKVSKKQTIYYPKTIKLSSPTYTYNGKVKKPSISIKSSNGKTIGSGNYTVKYASGRKNAGTYKVKVTFKGNYSGSVTKTFTIKKAKQTISASNKSKTYGSNAFALGAKSTKGNGKLTYKSSNTNVATVSSNGKISIKGVGKSTITITAAATSNYNKATKSITVTVKAKVQPTPQVQQTVWLSATGSKYHRIPNCGKMNPAKARQVDLSYASSHGFGPCSKCF